MGGGLTSRAVRVLGLTTFARVLGFVPLVITVVAATLGWEAAQRRDPMIVEFVALSLMAVFWSLIAARGLLLRVELRDGELRAVQWWRTTSVALKDVEAVFAMGYAGILNWGGIGPSLGLGGAVHVAVRKPTGSEVRAINATLTFAPLAAKKADRLRSAISALGYEIADEAPADLSH